jgi:hypothetical protein
LCFQCRVSIALGHVFTLRRPGAVALRLRCHLKVQSPCPVSCAVPAPSSSRESHRGSGTNSRWRRNAVGRSAKLDPAAQETMASPRNSPKKIAPPDDRASHRHCRSDRRPTASAGHKYLTPRVCASAITKANTPSRQSALDADRHEAAVANPPVITTARTWAATFLRRSMLYLILRRAHPAS